MPFDVSKVGKGAIPIPLSIKDYRLELATAILPTALPPKYSLREYIGKVKTQGGSGSCVAQAFSYYAEVLNKKETNQSVALSARDIYSLIFIDPMGAWLKDAAGKICKSGVVMEVDAPSYDKGQPPSEQFMRKRDDITQEEVGNGYSFLSEKYLTWDARDVQKYKEAILTGSGVVSSFAGSNYTWSNANIKLLDNMQQSEWWHAIYLTGWDDSKQCFEFVNSWGKEWGEQGFGWLPYDYVRKGFASNPITLKDVPNETYIKLLSQILNLYQKILEALKLKKK